MNRVRFFQIVKENRPKKHRFKDCFLAFLCFSADVEGVLGSPLVRRGTGSTARGAHQGRYSASLKPDRILVNPGLQEPAVLENLPLSCLCSFIFL